ncbi:MAG: hypothetical protein U9Q83_12315, partial [Bacteroidota bacterium]|nr:hypothetical protein [Bacteroidota bacterium]
MKTTKKQKFLIVIFLSLFFILNSCEFKPIDEFLQGQFPETNIESAEIIIDGQIAVPILNSSLRLTNLLPSMNDSTFWLEVDNDDLIHLRMYHKDLFNITPDEMNITGPFP